MRDPLLAAPAHAVCLAATAVLVVNDHLLKVAWPGWVTGKLSDVAWLVVAPVVVATLLRSAAVPAAVARAVALVGVGALFVLLQLWPALGDTWVAWTGGSHTPDPTDLIALPALGLAWLCWRRTPPVGGHLRRVGRHLALGGAAAACLATSWGGDSDRRYPCDGETAWDPNQPLFLHFAWDNAVPIDSEGFDVTIRRADGSVVDAWVRSFGSNVVVCPVGGLEPSASFTWTVTTQWTGSPNHLPVPIFDRQGEASFQTAATSALSPVNRWQDCGQSNTETRCCDGDTGWWCTSDDTGCADSGCQ